LKRRVATSLKAASVQSNVFFAAECRYHSQRDVLFVCLCLCVCVCV
jgi:hypothetical protein